MGKVGSWREKIRIKCLKTVGFVRDNAAIVHVDFDFPITRGHLMSAACFCDPAVTARCILPARVRHCKLGLSDFTTPLRGGSNSMTSSKSDDPLASPATKFLIKSMICVISCVGAGVCAQAQDAHPNNTDRSRTATSQTSLRDTSPTRTTESHVRSGNQSVDRQIVEALGPNGRYQPSGETEKETVQVNATTTRTVVRTYSWDVNGQRKLEQVTEEEARTSASGDVHVIRTTSGSDGNGNLQVVQREVADTRKTSPDEQETKTTTYLLNGNSDLTPSLQTRELQKRSADHRVEVKKTLLQPDSSGNWQVAEVKQSTIKEDNKNRTSEERISRPDPDGGLSEVSRTVGKETENAAGEKSTTVETYFTNAPGVAADGGLRLNWQVTTVQKTDSGGKTIDTQRNQSNPNDANGGLQVSTRTKYTVRYAASGTEENKTIQERDINGALHVVSVESRKSDQPTAAQGQTAPSEKPK
jgi:hypothetical protein